MNAPIKRPDHAPAIAEFLYEHGFEFNHQGQTPLYNEVVARWPDVSYEEWKRAFAIADELGAIVDRDFRTGHVTFRAPDV